MVARVREQFTLDGDVWPVIQRFVATPGTWLPLPAQPVGTGRWLSTVHGGPTLQTVTVTLGEAWSLPDAHTRHLVFEPTDARAARRHPHVLPAFEGQLTLRHGDGHPLILVLEGHYEPPGGTMGEAADAVLLHRVAGGTARRFVCDIADRLCDRRAATVGVAPGGK